VKSWTWMVLVWHRTIFTVLVKKFPPSTNSKSCKRFTLKF
jgi:hypothetical protein